MEIDDSVIKQQINQQITSNGNKEITASRMRLILIGVIDWLKNSINAALEILSDAVATVASQYDDRGSYNATTNSPALTVDASIGRPGTKMQMYRVTVAGPAAFAGHNFAAASTLNVGDLLIELYNTKWYRVPFVISDGSITRTKLSTELIDAVGAQYNYVRIGNKKAIWVLRAENGDILDAHFTDDTRLRDKTFSVGHANGLSVNVEGNNVELNFGSADGAQWGDSNVKEVPKVYVLGKRATRVELAPNGDVVACTWVDGTSYSKPMGLDEVIVQVTDGRGQSLTLKDLRKNVISDYGLPTTPDWGSQYNMRWIAWMKQHNYAFNIVVGYDSYSGNRDYWLSPFFALLLGDGHSSGGPGYLGVTRFHPTNPLSINKAMTDGLYVTFGNDANVSVTDWDPAAGAFAPDGYVTALVAGSLMIFKATEAFSSIKFLFEKHPSAGQFRWKLNNGAWTNVSTANATQVIANFVVDTSGAGANFTVTIDPIDTGVRIIGAIPSNPGNLLTIHKIGNPGQAAAAFSGNALRKEAIKELNPHMFIILGATNDLNQEVDPATFETQIENQILDFRAYSPLADGILICAPNTLYGSAAQPKKYPMAAYARAMFRMAQKHRCRFINLAMAMGAYSTDLVTAGMINVDEVHTGTAGAIYIAETVFKPMKK